MCLQLIPGLSMKSRRHLKTGCPATSSFDLCQSENIQANGEQALNVDNTMMKSPYSWQNGHRIRELRWDRLVDDMSHLELLGIFGLLLRDSSLPDRLV